MVSDDVYALPCPLQMMMDAYACRLFCFGFCPELVYSAVGLEELKYIISRRTHLLACMHGKCDTFIQLFPLNAYVLLV